MLILTTVMYLLQLLQGTFELSMSQTKLDILSYWKTTDMTDRVPDYWNHGPFGFPRQDSLLVTKKHYTPASDTEVPKKSTESATNKAATKTKTPKSPAIDRTLEISQTLAATEVASNSPIIMIRASDVPQSRPTVTKSISKPKFRAATALTLLVPKFTTKTQKTPLTNHFRSSSSHHLMKLEYNINNNNNNNAVFYDYDATKRVELQLSNIPSTTSTETTVTANFELIEITTSPKLDKNRAASTETLPFSVFLEKLFKILSIKRTEELALLVDQFKEYIHILLTSGNLTTLGMEVNSFIAKTILMLDDITPDKMPKYIETIQNLLLDRERKLPKLINDLLNQLDDLYDEAEEEAMQAVLYEATFYPDTKNKNKLAQGFVDYVFLKPMHRVAGTLRGNTIFQMLTTAVKTTT